MKFFTGSRSWYPAVRDRKVQPSSIGKGFISALLLLTLFSIFLIVGIAIFASTFL